MKQIVIKIPDEIYKGTMQIKESRGISSEDVIQIPLECISNGTVLPDNPTNGEMIETMFAAIKEIHAMTRTVFVVLHDGAELEFDRNWWNSPYEAKEQDA